MTLHPKLIDFFKKHNMYDEEMFKYITEQSTMIDYDDPDQRCFVGCFYILDKNGKLTGLKLNLPYVNSEETMLISIHELTHGYENYQKIGKKFKKDITIEALPLFYEKVYTLENSSERLQKYSEYLDKIIMEESEKQYQFGLKIREELLKQYHNNPQETIRLIAKLGKKYHFEEWKNKMHHK